MKAFCCAATIRSLSLLLGSLGLLSSCSLETTGSGDISLSADDEDVSSDDFPDPADNESGDTDDDEGPGGNVDGGPSNTGKDASADDDDDDDGEVRKDFCRPGNYQGSYVCKQPPVTTPPWAVGFGGSEIGGTFTFRLTPTGKADALELTGGTIHNEQLAFFKLDATITATLTCGRPLKGQLTDARYTNFIGMATSFESPFDATFDETTGNFEDGSWLVTDANGTLCDGTWTATRTD